MLNTVLEVCLIRRIAPPAPNRLDFGDGEKRGCDLASRMRGDREGKRNEPWSAMRCDVAFLLKPLLFSKSLTLQLSFTITNLGHGMRFCVR